MNIRFEYAGKYRKQVKQLFLSAFPRDERPPLFLLYLRHHQKRASFQAVLDGEKFVGLTLVTGSDRVKTLMFLAIEGNCRGMGYGSEVLKEMKKKYGGLPFFLCAEPLDEKAENAREREKRLQFYAGNGFTEIGLTVTEAGVPFTVLTPGTPLTQAQYLDAMMPFFGRLYYNLVIK